MQTFSASSGTVSPTSVGPFSGGVWSGPVTIGAVATNVTLTCHRWEHQWNQYMLSMFRQRPPAPAASGIPRTRAHEPLQCRRWSGGARRQVPLPPLMGISPPCGSTGVQATLAPRSSVTCGLPADTQLAEATFPTGTPAGWQEVTLSDAGSDLSRHHLRCLLHTTSGYAVNTAYFTAANRSAFERPPLRALVDGEQGGNGTYMYGPPEAFQAAALAVITGWM